MRICVISSTVFSVPILGYGGLEVIAWQLAKGLAERGHQVSMVAPDGSSCPGVQMILGGPPGQWDEKTTHGKVWQHYLNVDCIVDHSWNKWSNMLKVEGRLKSTPILNVCHAPVDTMFKELWPIEKLCMVCISQDQASHFETLFGPRKAKVAYNGCDTEFYKPLGIPRSDRFLFLARFSTIKGPDLAIEACKKMGVGLDLVGDTSITNEPEFLNKCKRMCDGKQIRMIGGVTRGETVWWYSQARALLHPNMRFREPFGLAPVEAMDCGCPVIAWDYGAMRETISQGRSGWLVNSEQELGEIITIAKHRPDQPLMALDESMRTYSREWALQFSVDKMVNRYEELCLEAVKTGGW